MINKFSQRKVWFLQRIDVINLAVLIIFSLLFISQIYKSLDITLYDESIYMDRGINLLRDGVPVAQNSSLYSIWYFILSLIQSDPIKLQLLNYGITTIFPSLLLYIFLRIKQVNSSFTLFVSFITLFSTLNFEIVTKPYHFALIFFLILISFIELIKDNNKKLFYMNIGILLISYIRPEFLSLYWLFNLIYIVYLFRNHQPKKLILYMLISSLLIVIILGVPPINLNGYRSFFAFGQHFSLNWTTWNNSDIDPWTNWQNITAQNYGSARTVFGAFINNPSMFMRHIITNTLNLPTVMAKFFVLPFSKYPQITSYTLIGSITLAYSVLTKRKSNTSKIMNYWLIIPFLLIVLVSTIVVYPRNHYVIMAMFLLTIILSIYFDRIITTKNNILLNILYIVLICISPLCFSNISLGNRANVKVIQTIQGIHLKGNINILESEGGYDIYLGDNFHRVPEYDKSINFEDFLKQRNINLIVVTSRLQKDIRFKNDKEWLYFLENYQKFGFSKSVVNNTDIYLLVNDNIK